MTTTTRKIAVIGAGTMGRGIAHVSALGGFETNLYDISADMLKSAQETINSNLSKAVARNIIGQAQADSALERLSFERDLNRVLQDCNFVIEAVPEKIEIKTELFGQFDRLCSREAVFASNTSSLSITEIAAVVSKPQRVIGMHFFNPVHKMKLVEIVKGLETDEATILTTQEVGRQMGKEIVTIKESPGFITSRINAMIGNEAFYMLQEGIASAEEIDKALKLGLNHPMGPFEMVDLVGLDTRLSILKFLHQTLGEKYRPCPLMEQYVRAGRLGRKAGKGVYDYSD